MIKILKLFYKTILIILVSFFTTGLGMAIWLWAKLPSAQMIKGCMITTMYQVHLCPSAPQYVKLNQISPFLKKTVLVSEDSLFYQHHGFDWDSMQASFEKDLEKGKFARGGSTITQQLAKNLFLSKEKSLWRKLKEAIITQRIEQTLTKNEILERYLNVVQFGKNIFGVKKAAQFYFNKQPSQLNLSECAFLAFLLPSPERYSVSYFKKELTKFARQRMKFVITGLYKAGSVKEEEYNTAIKQLEFFPNSKSSMDAIIDNSKESNDSSELSESIESPKSMLSAEPIDETDLNDSAESNGSSGYAKKIKNLDEFVKPSQSNDSEIDKD